MIATLSLGWLLGWVSGPLLTGDDSTLRMDYFKLLPIPAARLARGILGAAFANPSLLFSLIAFAALIGYGAQSSAAAALTGVAAVLLDLVLAVVASTMAIAVFGPAISSRRGRDFGTIVLALVITLLSLASGLVPFVAKRLTDGHSPALAAVVRILPSGWGAVAVDAAGRSDWGLAALALGGLAALIVVRYLAWPPLLARRLTRPPRGRSKAHHAGGSRGPSAAAAHPARSGGREGTAAVLATGAAQRDDHGRLLVGVLAAAIPAFGGKTAGLPFAGLLFTTVAAACFTNFYGDDGSAMWLTLIVPGAERSDLRGRQWAWFLVVGPAGLLALISVASVQGPAPDGGPTPQRVLKTHLALIAVPALTLFPRWPC